MTRRIAEERVASLARVGWEWDGIAEAKDGRIGESSRNLEER